LPARVKAPRTRRLAELNWQEFARLVPGRTDLVLLPVGTIEAHGVTGLGTDNQLPEDIAARIAPDINALIAPTVNYGITRALLPYPGSLTVERDTFERYCLEVAAGLADAGFSSIVFLNGHGGNTDALRNVCFRLFRERQAYGAVIDWWTLCADDVRQVYGQAGGHAGTDETALVLAGHPADVRRELYSDDLAYLLRPGLHAVPFPGSIMLYKENEGLPDFDPAKAGRLFDLVCARVTTTIRDVIKRWQRVRGRQQGRQQ
jgi:creatinine amidohydrolase